MSHVTPLRRTAITVEDLDRALRFYRQVLGLKVWMRGRAGPENPSFGRLMGAPSGTVRYAILQSGEVEWGMVGLFEVSAPRPPRRPLRQPGRAHRGEACLVFYTPDVRRIHRLASRRGAHVVCPPTSLVLEEHGVESLEMTLRDPDGVLLNFIQCVRGNLAPDNLFPGAPPAARPIRPRRPRGGRRPSARLRKPA